MTERTASAAPFTITRVFDASPNLVFKVWSEAERLSDWWGPKGFSIYVRKLEFRPGGSFHYSIEAGGNIMWGRFIYREIAEPERIVFVSSFSDEEGCITRAPFSKTWPLEILNTLTFTFQEGKTLLTLHGGPIVPTDEERNTFESAFDSLRRGFSGTFDKLAEYLETAQSHSIE